MQSDVQLLPAIINTVYRRRIIKLFDHNIITYSIIVILYVHIQYAYMYKYVMLKLQLLKHGMNA